MDVSQVAAARVQGAQGQHRHRPTIAERISQLESTIDDAVSAGALSGDEASHLKKVLADITKILNHNAHKQNGSNNQPGSAKPLSEHDRAKVRSDLQELEKQVSAVLDRQRAASAPAPAARGTQVDDLFKALDADGNGTIGKDELASFVNRTAGNGQGGNSPFGTYGQQGSIAINVSVNITVSQFSITV